MREESHLDDMRSALRGDFERLARRRGGQELLRVTDEPRASRETPPAAVEPSPEHAREPEDAQNAVAVDETERRTWLDRLLGR